MDESKKKYLIGGIVAGVAVVGLIIFFVFNSMKDSPEKALESYIESLQNNDYAAMYDNVTTDMKKDDFTKRLKNIYEGIEMKNLKMEVISSEDGDAGSDVRYKIEMDTLAGKIKFENSVTIIEKDGSYKMKWDESQIFPGLDENEKISVRVLKAQRGSIMDRNGTVLAKQGLVYNVGFIAGRMDDQDASIKAMAEALGMDENTIKTKMSAKWIKDDMFVPIKVISEQEKAAISEKLNVIDGASIQKDVARVYPYGEISAHLTGYVQSISAEELKKHKGEGYDENSVVGKSGLELVYEKELKETDGYEINIVNENGEVLTTLATKKAVNGKDIALTIDMKAQQMVYEQLKSDAGAGVMLDSHTGEVLAMVSMPSYDPNDFVLGISTEKWNSYNNSETTPLLNRVTNAYTPGSTFKAITGAVGLDSKTIDASTEYKKVDKWQKDKSWGNNYVTTTTSYSEPGNLEYAFKYSDNIFFAQLADNIGAKTYMKYLDSIGFNKKIDFPLAVTRSAYGKLDNDQKLAAAGYGQGELQISPLHLSALYTAYKNEGSILQPYLIYDSGKTKVLKKQAYSKESAETVFTDLQKTMDYFGDNPTHAAGKTGTAQVKKGEQEIGWLCAVNDNISLTLMIDDTKDLGESHYVIPKVQSILAAYQ